MRNSRRSSNDCALQHPPTDARRVGQPNRPQETPSGRFRPTSPELPREIQGIRNIRGRRHPDCNRRTSKGRTFGRFSLCCRSGKRDSHSRCARAVREYWQTPPAPGRGALRSQVPSPSCTGIQKKEGRTFWILPSCFGAENGFPTQAYSSFTISALREAFSSKVTPAMQSSCTRLHPNAFDKDKNYFHTIQERYSSCFLYTEPKVLPFLFFP